MRWLRLLACVVLLGALVVLVTKPSSSASIFPQAAPCTADNLTAPYHDVDSVTSFGCVGDYAYLWATIGTEPAEIGVTDLLVYNTKAGAWENAVRANYCTGDALPAYIKQQACNSN
ncbi:MAG TPA: hypothetical protein VG246_05355 [Acidimicrobiales bacterium]|jgi:hypothetical protein|nr:hypothetical protein [Acidimicrobiales bacterium]